jgi:hypothetical protein
VRDECGCFGLGFVGVLGDWCVCCVCFLCVCELTAVLFVCV